MTGQQKKRPSFLFDDGPMKKSARHFYSNDGPIKKSARQKNKFIRKNLRFKILSSKKFI